MTFAILYSHASRDTYPDLVHPDTYTTCLSAEDRGNVVDRASGSEHEVMIETPMGWRSRWNETPEEVINRRWTPRGRHECDFAAREKVDFTKSRVSRPRVIYLCTECGRRRW